MAQWRTDPEVFEAADRVGGTIIELLNSEGVEHAPGSPRFPGSGGDFIMRGLHQDALDVLSLDPQKIIDEFERMQQVGRALSQERSTELVDSFRTIDYSIQDWQGQGADAFRHQVSMIQAFIGQQCYYVVKTMEVLAILLSLSVHVRRDYCALADATVAAARKAMQQEQEADTKVAISIGTSVLGAAIGIASGGGWLITTAGTILSATGSLAQRSIDSDGSTRVVESYTGVRTELLQSYKDNITDARNRVQRAQDELEVEANELFAPLSPSIDIRAPTFAYRNFYNTARDLSGFGVKVDAEHHKLTSTTTQPGTTRSNSPIQQRLDG